MVQADRVRRSFRNGRPRVIKPALRIITSIGIISFGGGLVAVYRGAGYTAYITQPVITCYPAQYRIGVIKGRAGFGNRVRLIRHTAKIVILDNDPCCSLFQGSPLRP